MCKALLVRLTAVSKTVVIGVVIGAGGPRSPSASPSAGEIPALEPHERVTWELRSASILVEEVEGAFHRHEFPHTFGGVAQLEAVEAAHEMHAGVLWTAQRQGRTVVPVRNFDRCSQNVERSGAQERA